MDLLQQFLLLTAREEWESWYGVTRLVFADWCEENRRSKEAEELRAIKLVNTIGIPAAMARLAVRQAVLEMFPERNTASANECP
jgi:hypothetical protein